MRLTYLYDLPLPSPVAAPIQILHTCRALAERGWHVTTAWADVRGDALAPYGVEAHDRLTVASHFSRLTRLLPTRSLAKLVAGSDVVLSRGETGVKGWYSLKKLRNRPAFVYEAHRRCAASPGMSKASARRLEAAAVREADGVVGISRGVLDALHETHGIATPTLVLPSGVAPDDALAIDRDLDLLYAGKIERRKGVDLMLAALDRLPGVRLTLVGGDVVHPQVDAVGYVEPASVRGYFRRARVGVCPLPSGVSEVSDRFTSPMKILEMMACGTPIVATDLPSVRELLTDGRNALLVPPNDPPALAAGVRSLLDDRELAERLAAQARQDVAAYTWAERARKLDGFLRRIVAARSSR